MKPNQLEYLEDTTISWVNRMDDCYRSEPIRIPSIEARETSPITNTVEDCDRSRQVELTRYEAILLVRIHIEELTQVESAWHFLQITGGSERYQRAFACRRLNLLIGSGLVTEDEVTTAIEDSAARAGLRTPVEAEPEDDDAYPFPPLDEIAIDEHI